MGCDIHALVYAKRRKDAWAPEPVMAFREPRWYPLFAAMAGVRNSFDVDHIEPRGLPDWTTRNDFPYCPLCYTDVGEGERGILGDHSFSWLTTAEYREALGAAKRHLLAGENVAEYDAVLAFMEAMESDGHEAFIVFGFDS